LACTWCTVLSWDTFQSIHSPGGACSLLSIGGVCSWRHYRGLWLVKGFSRWAWTTY
jgi:hypothetical protein